MHVGTSHGDKIVLVTLEAVLLKSLCALTVEIKPRLHRRKFGAGSKHSLGGRPNHVLEEGHVSPVALTPEVLRTCFVMPLHEAARTLGIFATAVKKCCRKIGIKRWPFQALKLIQSRLFKLQSLSAATPDIVRRDERSRSSRIRNKLSCRAATSSVSTVAGNSLDEGWL